MATKQQAQTVINKNLNALMQAIDAVALNESAQALVAAQQDKAVTKITFDSRFATTGTVFFAIRGFEADGHNYLLKAEESGAVAAVIEYLPQNSALLQDLPLFQVKSSRQALAKAAAYFYDQPSSKLQLVGITASNGKTSTSLMYRQIVLAAQEACGLIGTVSYEVGENSEMSHLTTPDACKLQELLYQMVQLNYKHAVMECSSIGIDQARNYACRYKAVAFNNISREHLDYHGSFANYLAAKSKLITDFTAPDTAVILNYDDQTIYAQRKLVKNSIYAYGDYALWAQKLEAVQADLSAPDRAQDFPSLVAQNVDLTTGCASFDLCLLEHFPLPQYRGQTVHVRLQVPGYHSLMNALAAVALALACGFSLQIAVQGIEAYHGIERRFQKVFDQKTLNAAALAETDKLTQIAIYDDHFANPGNIEFSLQSLQKMQYRRLHVVYALRGKRGVTVNQENIAILKPYLPHLRLATFIATCSQDVVGHYDEVQPEELAAFKLAMDEIGQSYTLHTTLQAALAEVLEQVEAGDLILLAGCQGMDAGARLCLTQLAALRPQWDKERLLAVVADRICGQEDEAANKDKLFAGNAE